MQAGLAAEAAAAPSSAERHYERALELWDDAPEAAADSPLDRGALLVTTRDAGLVELSDEQARTPAAGWDAVLGQVLAAPAAETLRALPASQTFDFAFVDADKSNYRIYYEEILKRLLPNGLLLIDNVLWSGQVIDAKDKSEDTIAIRELNDFITSDMRVEAVLIPVADGITIVRKK